MEPVTLYRQAASGKLQFWSIGQVDYTIVIEHGYVNGETQEQTEDIPWGKAGRSRQEQLESRVRSRINKKTDAGYVHDRDVAIANKPTNAMGFRKPMLAKKPEDIPGLDLTGMAVQNKFDGHRCLIHRDGDKFIAYSRNGKPITTVPEIVREASKLGLSNGMTLDGELYIHGLPIQTIGSLVKRRQVRTTELVYVLYDVMMGVPYSERYFFMVGELGLNKLFGGRIRLAPTLFGKKESEIPALLKQSRDDGFEGLILRNPSGNYEDGKRSKNLIKIKVWIDDEFEVFRVTASKDDWGVLHCRMPNGKEFHVSAPGSIPEKEDVLIHQSDFIGRSVNVQYACLTNEGKPFHPVATGWRDKGSE